MIHRSIFATLVLLCGQAAVDASVGSMSNRSPTSVETETRVDGPTASRSETFEGATRCCAKCDIGCRTTTRGVTRIDLCPIYNDAPVQSFYGAPVPSFFG